MFTLEHLLWVLLSILMIVLGSIHLRKKDPSLDQVLTWAIYIWVASELVKVFGTIEIIPSADGTRFYPYLETNHLPFHLCSMQIVTMLLAKHTKSPERRNSALAFLATTSTLGAFFAIALPSVLGSTVPLGKAFLHPIAYQTFVYHSMLITLGLYLLRSGKVSFTKKEYFLTMKTLSVLAFATIYLNSALGDPIYQAEELVSVEHTTNFLFTYLTPIGLQLKEKWQWFLYLLVLAFLAFFLIGLFYIPAFRKKDKKPE